MEIKYNKPFEVTRAQYARLMGNFGGIVAGRWDSKTNKFYIKTWRTNIKYVLAIHDVLNNVK